MSFAYKFLCMLLVSMLLTPSYAMAKSVVMKCEQAHYKYEKRVFREAKVFVRENASWKPWCAGAITINEMGATCKKAAVFKKGEEVFEYNYVDYFHQNKVRKLLSKRHAYCRKNVDDPICEARGSGSSWGASFISSNSSLFKKEPEENKPSWNFHCSQSSQGPTYERKDFHVLPLSEYIDMHLPKIGDRMCIINTNFIVRQKTNFDILYFLDFLLLAEKIVGHEKDMQKVVTTACKSLK